MRTHAELLVSHSGPGQSGPVPKDPEREGTGEWVPNECYICLI